MVDDDSVTEELTGILHDLALEFGPETAINMADAFGGSKLYIPSRRRLTDKHPIARALGLRPAQWLAEHCGGDDIIVPTGLALRVLVRNRAIHAGRLDGLTSWELAKRHRISRRQVMRVLAEPAVPDI